MNPTRRALLGWLASVPVALRLSPAAPAPTEPPPLEHGSRVVRSADELYAYLRRFHPALFIVAVSGPWSRPHHLISRDTLTISHVRERRGGVTGRLFQSETLDRVTFTAAAAFRIEGGGA